MLDAEALVDHRVHGGDDPAHKILSCILLDEVGGDGSKLVVRHDVGGRD